MIVNDEVEWVRQQWCPHMTTEAHMEMNSKITVTLWRTHIPCT